jgi:putative membrane protein
MLGTFAPIKIADHRKASALSAHWEDPGILRCGSSFALAKRAVVIYAGVREFINKKITEECAMGLPETPPVDRGTALAEERTALAIQRTNMAAERSLMAWVRTSLSMIGFGFSIYKFFQYLPEELATGNIRRPQAPRNLGLTLIALGTLALAAASWQHWNFLKAVRASQTRHVWSISFVVAIFVILIGLITFYGVLLRHGPF